MTSDDVENVRQQLAYATLCGTLPGKLQAPTLNLGPLNPEPAISNITAVRLQASSDADCGQEVTDKLPPACSQSHEVGYDYSIETLKLPITLRPAEFTSSPASGVSKETSHEEPPEVVLSTVTFNDFNKLNSSSPVTATTGKRNHSDIEDEESGHESPSEIAKASIYRRRNDKTSILPKMPPSNAESEQQQASGTAFSYQYCNVLANFSSHEVETDADLTSHLGIQATEYYGTSRCRGAMVGFDRWVTQIQVIEENIYLQDSNSNENASAVLHSGINTGASNLKGLLSETQEFGGPAARTRSKSLYALHLALVGFYKLTNDHIFY